MFVPGTFIITLLVLVARVHGAKNQPKTPSAGSNVQPGENTQVTTLDRPTDALFVTSSSEYRTSVASTVSSSASVATPSLSPPGEPFQKPVNISFIVKPESLIGGEVANAWFNDLSYYQTYDGDKTDELEGKNTDGEEGDRDDDEKKAQRDRELAWYNGHLKLGEMKYSRLFSMGRKFVWQQQSEDPKVLIKVCSLNFTSDPGIDELWLGVDDGELGSYDARVGNQVKHLDVRIFEYKCESVFDPDQE